MNIRKGALQGVNVNGALSCCSSEDGGAVGDDLSENRIKFYKDNLALEEPTPPASNLLTWDEEMIPEIGFCQVPSNVLIRCVCRSKPYKCLLFDLFSFSITVFHLFFF